MTEEKHPLQPAETMFLVVVYPDGRIATHGEIPTELPTIERVANNFDVYQKCKEIVDEFEQGMLAQRVAAEVARQLQPPAEMGISDRMAEALRERGIVPDTENN